LLLVLAAVSAASVAVVPCSAVKSGFFSVAAIVVAWSTVQAAAAVLLGRASRRPWVFDAK